MDAQFHKNSSGMAMNRPLYRKDLENGENRTIASLEPGKSALNSGLTELVACKFIAGWRKEEEKRQNPQVGG